MAEPTAQSVLGVLPKPRLIALGRDVDISVPPAATKDAQIRLLVDSGRLRFRELLRRLDRDELRAACREHGIDDSGRARVELASRLMQARGSGESAPPQGLFLATEIARHRPRRRDIVLCRHRQWLVEDVVAPQRDGDATVVRLVCLDDDNQGRVLEVLWELELGARVHRPEAHGLGAIDRIDPPRHFGAYLHALKWNAVTATDGCLFQAPFRAGIELQAHQLVPLQKALELPRANLFIADDVGLGKTIEAGLILSELSLRQRVDFALIICPAGVTLQWRDEMQRRFGVQFVVMSRAFVARRRKERGFGVNPWSTHARFIISHQLIRRPEYREQLLTQLGDRTKKSLLILDEAHVAAPASSSKYAVDSQLTKVMRDIAPRFENRLFLSATPHNGHSNSFSALLELLDAQRFTRGVRIDGKKQLEAVMVRRLKQDLRDAGVSASFPERRVVQLALAHSNEHWLLTERRWDKAQQRYEEEQVRDLGEVEAFELDLARDLARYTELAAPKGRGRLVFVSLQKRLLSSVEAFARTLRVHARAVQGEQRNVIDLPVQGSVEDASADDEYGPDEETLELFEEGQVGRDSRALGEVRGEAGRLLESLLHATERDRHRPDAKVLALIDWIRRNQCSAVRVGGADSQWPRKGKGTKRTPPANADWTDRRLIIFTEYGDTKRYLMQLLTAAVRDTPQADDRILQLHGGMSDESREEVQRAFNTRPDQHPVRILIATDAAREGINLQAFCADLIHFDVPWNPARMEQRNGRIDRALQPASEVSCRYFSYSDREADPVLATLVEKVEVITRELGSLGAVVMDEIATELDDHGVTAKTKSRLAQLASPRNRGAADTELEATRLLLQKLRDQVEDASVLLERSRKLLEFDTSLLREAIDVGFELAGAGKLNSVPQPDESEPALFAIPELPDSWQRTLDALRPPRRRDQSFWDFRNQAPQPVSFEPSRRLGSQTVQLHLQHPLVQRVFSRFLAQGFSTSDLSRVTVLRNRHDALVRVIAFGRLSLFGSGAARLHDELISVAARWFEGKKEPLRPFAEEGDRKAVELLERILAEAPSLSQIPKALQERVRNAAPDLFAQLWKPIREEADARAVRAVEKLKARGRSESDQLREILGAQRNAIERRLQEQKERQLELEEIDKLERAQREADLKHMTKRLARIGTEVTEEPAQIEALYEVALNRLSPVGLVVLWPATRL
jgi:superfamily II DNA or RNA helicase